MRKRAINKALKLCGYQVIKGIDFPMNNDCGCVVTSYIACGVVKVMNISWYDHLPK